MAWLSVNGNNSVQANSTTYNSSTVKNTNNNKSIFDKPISQILSNFGASVSSTIGELEHTILDTKFGDILGTKDTGDNSNTGEEVTNSNGGSSTSGKAVSVNGGSPSTGKETISTSKKSLGGSFSSNDTLDDTAIDFEDGNFPGTVTKAQEPAKIEEENGNKFLRLTANYEDQEGIEPASEYPDRVRATMYMTKDHLNMPILDDTNKNVSYSADIRFIDNKTPKSGDYVENSFFELFQASSKDSGTNEYGNMDNPQGPVARFIRDENGNVSLVTQTKGSEPQKYDLGHFDANKFYNFKLVADWSTTPGKGSYKVYVKDESDENSEEKEVLNLEGVTACYWPGVTDLVPAMKCGLYGENAVGSVDVDNVKIDNLND